MILIAHRGNTNGPTIHENQPLYLLEAIESGYDVEIDVWFIGGRLWSGHDKAEYLIDNKFVESIYEKAWFHCKNIAAAQFLSMSQLPINYFWHESDEYTITSSGLIWANVGHPGGLNTVCVLPEKTDLVMERSWYGICSDYVDEIKKRQATSSSLPNL